MRDGTVKSWIAPLGVYGPKCALVGAYMRMIESRDLGVSTFPGDMRRTHFRDKRWDCKKLDCTVGGVRTQMCSRQGPHAHDRIARLGGVHLPRGCGTDIGENESPLPVYGPKVEA
ncbi:hypothetical protein CRG98_042032 [Punica granatum]|uniref:Uncharacterized protein n=1 Tax=Punica granatum TaxID=22663 RepID=A0A2I0I0T9_PUNGR|nr:hypothetical protein CRG98_042032 [Punica granatum]